MKKKAKVLLASIMMLVFALCLTACSGDEESSASSSSADGTQSAVPTLTVAIQANSFVSDYEDNYLTNYLEDKLGINIEFYMLSASPEDVRTQVSLLATGGDDLPDVLLVSGGTLTPEAILNYGANAVFAILDDYISDPQAMPNYNAIPEEDKAVMETAQTMADGHTYSLSLYEPETWNVTPNRMFINRAWLDKLGLDMPTTTDELKEVLIAFRDGDPNGNGIKDEIGIYGWQSGTYGQNIIAALMNSFEFWNGGTQNGGLALAEDGKTVIAPFTQEGWKEGLRYMNDLYNEGVLSASTFTDSDTQYRATLNEETNCVALTSSGSLSSWPDAANNKNFLEMELMEPLTGPDGKQYTPYTEYSPNQTAFIFEGTDNMDLAIRFLDEFYDSYTSIVSRFGEEGVDWTQDPEFLATTSNSYIAEGIYDAPFLSYISNQWQEITNVTWKSTNPRYATLEEMNSVTNGNVEFNPEDPTQLNAKNEVYYYDKHPEKVLPLLHYTVEESNEIQQAVTNIPDYVNQSMARFITGDLSIDTDWDTYLSNLENMGLSQWLETAQEAYNRSL